MASGARRSPSAGRGRGARPRAPPGDGSRSAAVVPTTIASWSRDAARTRARSPRPRARARRRTRRRLELRRAAPPPARARSSKTCRRASGRSGRGWIAAIRAPAGAAAGAARHRRARASSIARRARGPGPVRRTAHDVEIRLLEAGQPRAQRVDSARRPGQRRPRRAGRRDAASASPDSIRPRASASGAVISRSTPARSAARTSRTWFGPWATAAHVERVGDRDALEAELVAQHARHDPGRQRRRQPSVARQARAPRGGRTSRAGRRLRSPPGTGPAPARQRGRIRVERRQPEVESSATSPMPGKCLSAAATPADWRPRTVAATSSPRRPGRRRTSGSRSPGCAGSSRGRRPAHRQR